MQNPLEIIVTTHGNPKPQRVQFESLFPLKDQLISAMLLWNTNSYYVNAKEKVMMINGGRRVEFPDLSECEILYRRRNAVSLTVTGRNDGPSHRISWIIGLKEKDGDRIIAVVVTNEGTTWTLTKTL